MTAPDPMPPPYEFTRLVGPVRFFVNGVDISAHSNTVTFDPIERPVELTTTFRADDPLDELLRAAGITPKPKGPS